MKIKDSIKLLLGVYDLKEAMIPLETEGKSSHYVWDGNNEIICTVLDRHFHAGYYRFNISQQTKTHICPNCLAIDGHPSIYDKNTLLTDTYPDTRFSTHLSCR